MLQQPQRLAADKLPDPAGAPLKPLAPRKPAGGDGSGPEPSPQRPQERILAAALAYSGTVGTIAATLAYFGHIDMFATLDLADSRSIYAGLLIAAPVYAMNLAIMWPQFSNWKLPQLSSMQVRVEAAAQPQCALAPCPVV